MTGRGSTRVAFVVAAAVSVSWGVALVITLVPSNDVNSEAAALLSTIGGVLAGGVAAWLGNTSEQRDPTARTRVTDEPEPQHPQIDLSIGPARPDGVAPPPPGPLD